MNYNLARQRQSTPQHGIDKALPYGDMPTTMLMRKFEETDTGDEEMAVETFIRGEIKNWEPDTAIYEHERSRGGVNARSGKLNLQYEGHRGSAQWEKPETFLGFIGPEDRDPRGTNVDPDMKELTRQKWARGRFHRFGSDNSEQAITGGGVSEAGMMAIRQQVHRHARANLKVFSRQIDGRREGMRRNWKHVSDASKQVRVQAYGDYIKDYALNPQRRTTIITREIIRDSKAWRDQTNDQDLAFAQYSQIRRQRTRGPIDSSVQADAASQDLADSDVSKSFKAIGLLMSHLVREKIDRDQDSTDGGHTQTRKAAPCAKDLAAILVNLTQGQDFNESDNTQQRKQNHAHASTDAWVGAVQNHVAPAHHYLNSELIYKNLVQSGDLNAVAREVLTDAEQARAFAEKSTAKSYKWTAKARAVDIAEDNVDRQQADNAKYISYRAVKQVVGAWTPQNVDQLALAESDNSQVRRRQDRYKANHKGDTREDTNFKDNTYKDRHGAPVGSKYLRRHENREDAMEAPGQSDFKGGS